MVSQNRASRGLAALVRRGRDLTYLAALLAMIHVASAATAVHTLNRDLRPLIRAAASSPVQFAVEIPYAVSPDTAGSWSKSGGQATWGYAVRVPTAVSLSFHALHVRLPESAVLTVRGSSTTVTYRGSDVHGTQLWSRIQPGDALQFTLQVALSQRSAVRLDIISLQAGYRSIGAGVHDQPYYRRLRQKTQLTGTTNSNCVQNYECSLTASNTPAAQATVGLVVANLYQCTGTLINDVPQDNTPYILTARHCETGRLGGGNPGAAADVTVYWDAVTPCGSTLGALYDPGVITQTGATTLVEQQDAWLIRLDDSPVVSDAVFSGLDATGDAVQGGYTIHHALGYDKQFTTWFGAAYPVQDSGALGVSYESDFWETVNATGNIGPGSSGSGLFNQNDVLVGSLTLGRQTTDTSGYGSCPEPTPPAPDGANGAADFTRLAAVWNSVADATSSTLPATLQSVLDPQNSGTKLVSSTPAASMTFTAASYSLPVSGSTTLTWNAPGATECTAGGGAAGDGWQGSLAAAGSQQVSEGVAGDVIYTLACQLSGGRTLTSSVTVTWGNPQPLLNMTGSGAVWTTTPATLRWTSNLAPCSINGGSLSVGNLPSSGSITTTQSAPGDVTYDIQCGSGAQTLYGSWDVSYVTPSVQFTANGTDRQLGQPLTLSWITYAPSCTSTGGAPDDGWASNDFFNPQYAGGFSPNVTTLGTYTYTLTCTAGTISISQSVTVTIENNPAYVTLSASPTTTVFYDSPADFITLNWNSNLTDCDPHAQPLDGGFIVPALSAQGTATYPPVQPGTYTMTVTCAPAGTYVGSVTSPPVTVTVEQPPDPTATLSVSPTTIQVGQSYTVTWNSSNAPLCSGTDNSPPGLNWLNQQLLLSGSVTATALGAGQFTFGIDCPSFVSTIPDATAKATLTVLQGAPSATLSASPATLQVGQSLTLKWSSTNAAYCSAGGGGADGSPWSGTLANSGTTTQSVTTPGSFTYRLTCTGGTESSTAQASVTVSDGSGSGKGGGGAFSLLELLALTGALGFRGGSEARRMQGRRACRRSHRAH
jgi:lysyl endopeptidase